MKIFINLSEAEVKGIKEYLKTVDGIEKPLKKDIQNEVKGIVNGAFQSQHSALADYISKYENR